MSRYPLKDIKVLDLSWVIAGPHATHLFKELGAEVIKVESKKSLDVVRTGGARKGNTNIRAEGGWAFQDLNRGKMDMAINLKSEKGREVLEQLVKRADVVVSNFGVSAFKKLKLTYEDLSQVKPDIIVLNASGLGNWGPYSNFVTFAPALQSMTGINGSVGYEGNGAPYDGFPPLADYMGALAVANHLLAAIEYRRRTGKGQFIDLSQGEAAVSYIGAAILDAQVNQRKSALFGNHHYTYTVAPHNAYRCAGDYRSWCVIAVMTEEDWKNFCEAVDPEKTWTADPRFATAAGRVEHQKELDQLVEAWTMEHTPWEVAELMQAKGVSAAPVRYAMDVLYEDEQFKDRDYLMEVDFPQSDKFPARFLITGQKGRMLGYENPHVVDPAPSVGQDTDYVLREILKRDEAWIAEAKAEGCFE